jgi:hypothetical protein
MDEFESSLQAYTNQISSYDEVLNSYKDQLINAKDQAKDVATQIGLSAVPLALQGAQLGVTSFLGNAAGSTFGQVLTPDAIAGLTKGDASTLLANLKSVAEARASALANGGEVASAETETAVESPLMAIANSARALVSSGGEAPSVDAISSAMGSAIARLGASAGITTENLSGIALPANLEGLTSGVLSKLGSGLASTADVESAVSSATSSLPGLTNIASSLASQGSRLIATNLATLNANIPAGAGGYVNLSGAVSEEAMPNLLSSATSLLSEPQAMAGTSSNMIARAINGARALMQSAKPQVTEMPESELTGTVTETETSFSSAVPEEVGTFTRAVTGLGETVESGLSTAIATGTEALSGAVSGATGAITGALSGALSGGETAATAIGTGLAEAGGEVAAGSAFGPVGLVIGGLVALGSILGSLFGHHISKPEIPIMPAAMSIPTFQAGLMTGS